MIKMKKSLILLSLAALSVASCQDGPGKIDYDSKNLTINATIQTSKTSICSTSIEWNANDQILLAVDGETYTFATSESGPSASFTSEDVVTAGQVKGLPLIAYYGCSATGSFTIAQNQTISNGLSRSKMPMYAYTMESPVEAVTTMKFIPVASAMEIAIAPYNITINKVELSAVDESSVNGSFCGTSFVNALTGKVTSTSTLNSVAAVFTEGVNASTGATLLFPIGWFSIEGGIKMTITYNETETYEDILFADAPFQTFEGSGDAKSYKFIHTDVVLSIGPRDWYVAANGNPASKGLTAAAPTTLATALANADAGSTIHIAAGTYTPSAFPKGYEGDSEVYKTFEISKPVTIVGESAETTILDGGKNVLHTMIVTAAPDEKLTIEGLTIKGGKAGGDGEFTSAVNEFKYQDSYAGGLYIAQGNVSLKNCVVTGNEAPNGCGIFTIDSKVEMDSVKVTGNSSTGNGCGIWLSSSEATVTNGEISNNSSTSGVAAGLYVYATKGDSCSANVENTIIKGNTTEGNASAIYVRGADATANVTATFKGCEISSNRGNMGASFSTIYATAEFDSCKIKDNVSSGNGGSYIQYGSNVTMKNCLICGNSATMAPAGYVYTNNEEIVAQYINCEICDNISNGRGGALYARAAATKVTMNVINSNIHGNYGKHQGSAIALYGTANFTTTLNLFSSTITDNTADNATMGGAIGFETAGLTANIYNSIISGNIQAQGSADPDLFIKSGITPTIVRNKSVIGASTYDAKGDVVAEAASFAAQTMLSEVSDVSQITKAYKLIGESNPALIYGMLVSDLKSAAAPYFSNEIAGADQWGNTRPDSVMGSYTGK